MTFKAFQRPFAFVPMHPKFHVVYANVSLQSSEQTLALKDHLQSLKHELHVPLLKLDIGREPSQL